VYLSQHRDGSIRDGGVSCWCDLRLSMLISCAFASRAFAGGFRRAGRLQELLRGNDGSSEGVARTGVLGGGTGQVNVVILCIFVRLGLPGPRKARLAHASPPRPRARQSRLSRTTHAYALAKGVNTGRKGVDDGCGEGHMSLSGQTLSAAHISCHKGLRHAEICLLPERAEKLKDKSTHDSTHTQSPQKPARQASWTILVITGAVLR